MRNKLLATVAVAAVVGFGGFAAAQSQMGGESNKATPGATSGTTQQKSGGGSMSGSQSGNKTLSPSSTQSSNPSQKQSQSAQEKSGKTNERLGQGPKEEQRESKTGQAHENEQQKGAQQGGLQKNQKGAQEKSSTKGAQQERGMQQQQPGAMQKRGAEQQPSVSGRGTTEQTGQAGVTGGARGGPVQLSEDQRSQIKTIIGREHGPRLGRNVNFDIRVGTRIPRSVHFVVLPEEIVRIVPQFRGYDYVLVEDEIIVIDPRTLEIVAIIPA